MTKKSASKSRLVLIELIIMIVFLSLVGAICVNLFAKAHLLSERSSDLSRGIPVVQEAAEWVKQLAPDWAAVAERLGGVVSANYIVVRLDDHWEAVTSEDEVYMLLIALGELGEEGEGMYHASIRLCRKSVILHHVNVSAYRPAEGGMQP